MRKKNRRAKETRAGALAPARKRPAASRRKVKHLPLVERLIDAAEGVTSGRLKAIRLTGLSYERKLALLTQPIIPDDEDGLDGRRKS